MREGLLLESRAINIQLQVITLMHNCLLKFLRSLCCWGLLATLCVSVTSDCDGGIINIVLVCN